MDSQPVTFMERSDADAPARLDAVRQRVAAVGCATRLLRNRERPDLYLLVIEGDPALGDEEREGARVWRFGAVDAPGGSDGAHAAGGSEVAR